MVVPVKGKGTKIQVEIAEAFTDVSNVLTITPPQVTDTIYTWEEIDGEAVRKQGAGQPDGGQVTITVNENPESATHQFLHEQIYIGDPVDFNLVYSDGTEQPFSAVVSGHAPDEVQPKERVTGTFTLDVDDVVPFAEASGV